MKNMTKAIIADYAIATVTTKALYAVRPNAQLCFYNYDSDNEEIAKEAKKDMTIVAVVSVLDIGLRLISNKMITGHYIRIWK